MQRMVHSDTAYEISSGIFCATCHLHSHSTIWWFYHMYFVSLSYCPSWRPSIHFWDSFEYGILAVLVLERCEPGFHATLWPMKTILLCPWEFGHHFKEFSSLQTRKPLSPGRVGREMLPRQLVIWKCKNLLETLYNCSVRIKIDARDSKPLNSLYMKWDWGRKDLDDYPPISSCCIYFPVSLTVTLGCLTGSGQWDVCRIEIYYF